MRRALCACVAGGLVAALLGAGAAAAQTGRGGTGAYRVGPSSLPIRPGSVWLFRLSGGPCEVDRFGPHRFTTKGPIPDAGTYQAQGNHLKMTWTSGGDAGTSFAGTFAASTEEFSGLWSAGGDTIAATLRPGTTCFHR
jgi:hypothetical protein